MYSRTFTPTEGVNLEAELPFTAVTVVCDNVTPSWLLLPGAHRPVPPFQYGVTMPISPGSQVAQAFWVTPSKVIAPTPSNAQAYITFLDVEMTPSNGTPIVVPTQQVNLVGPIDVVGKAAGAVVASAVPVPPGANALMVVFDEADITNVTSIAVVDHVGNYQYIDMTTPRIANPAVGIFSPAAGGSVDLQVQTFSDGQVIRGMRLIAAFGTTAVAIQPSGFNLDVVGTQTTRGALYELFAQPGDAQTGDSYSADATITTANTLITTAVDSLEGIFLYNTGMVNALRVRFDGTNPTPTTGFRIPPGATLIRTRPDIPKGAINITTEAGSTTLNLAVWTSL